jgi:hypothetical protein
MRMTRLRGWAGIDADGRIWQPIVRRDVEGLNLTAGARG